MPTIGFAKTIKLNSALRDADSLPTYEVLLASTVVASGSWSHVSTGVYEWSWSGAATGASYDVVTTFKIAGTTITRDYPVTASAAAGLPPLGRFTYAAAYTSKKNSGNTLYTLNPVGYTPSTNQENHPSFGVYTRFKMSIDIPNSLLTSAALTPKPGDFFVGPDGNVYNVLRAQTYSIFVARVVGWCPTISLDLCGSIDYRQIVQTTDSYADRITNPANFKLLFSGQPARIQPASAATLDMLNKRGLENAYDCYTLPDVTPTYGDLVVDAANGNGTIQYKVIGAVERQRLEFVSHLLVQKLF